MITKIKPGSLLRLEDEVNFYSNSLCFRENAEVKFLEDNTVSLPQGSIIYFVMFGNYYQRGHFSYKQVIFLYKNKLLFSGWPDKMHNTYFLKFKILSE